MDAPGAPGFSPEVIAQELRSSPHDNSANFDPRYFLASFGLNSMPSWIIIPKLFVILQPSGISNFAFFFRRPVFPASSSCARWP